MTAVVRTDEILSLAQSRAPADRERLMIDLADLLAQSDASGLTDASVQTLMNSVFMHLVSTAEREIRKALSERLASAVWAPHSLVNILALDEIEIASPIIARSPLLQDEDLVRLMAMSTVEHQIAVASRPCIGEAVIETILKQADPAVMTALAGNDTADISREGLETLIEASRETASLRSPLVRHPKLSSEMAERLYVWVGQSLRSAIISRFRVDPDALDRELAGAIYAVQTPAPTTAAYTDTDRVMMERLLVSKLKASGQLRAGYLIKALHDQRLTLFCAALSERIGVPSETIDQVINAPKPDLLALACTAAGVDQSAFPTVLQLVRGLNKNLPGGGVEEGRRAMSAFGHGDAELALVALRRSAAA